MPNNFFSCRTLYGPESMAPKSQCDYQIQPVAVQSWKFEAPGCVHVAKKFLPTGLEIWNYLFGSISSLRIKIFNNNQKSLYISGLEKKKKPFKTIFRSEINYRGWLPQVAIPSLEINNSHFTVRIVWSKENTTTRSGGFYFSTSDQIRAALKPHCFRSDRYICSYGKPSVSLGRERGLLLCPWTHLHGFPGPWMC